MDTKSVLVTDEDYSTKKALWDVLKAKGHASIAAVRRALSLSGHRIHSTLRGAFVSIVYSERSHGDDSESLALLILILASLVIVMGTGLLLAIPRP
jgi:hypothetical protein